MTGQDSAEALAILRRFEPLVRYTQGERFFPIDVDRYVRQCSIWMKKPNQPSELLVSQEELTLERLSKLDLGDAGAIHFLKFIEPLDLLKLARYSFNQTFRALVRQDREHTFHAGLGRLARVGYGSRFVDALFSITLVWRGRVPGDTAAAAALTYERLQREDERYTYYGRVVLQAGWVILQYWFLYPFNNWRSGFFGVNDHEADWEMVSVYCCDAKCKSPSDHQTALPHPQDLTPHWVAYASHDFSGDDLRRRWDDPELELVGDHPVIYAGAGSHASYFASGEYLAEIELPFLSPLVKLVDRLQSFWVNTLRQAGAKAEKPQFNVFRIPFVDYARGDGKAIGQDQEQNWEACILDESTEWAVGYRGLWGLYAQDPIAGENAPAGPVYNRDGSLRRRWYDPLGWAGLDKVPPPNQMLEMLAERRAQTLVYCKSLEKQVAEKSELLADLGVDLSALQGQSHLKPLEGEYSHQAADLSQEVAELRRQIKVEQAKLETYQHYEAELRQGKKGPLRGHIHHAHVPSPATRKSMNVVAELLAAVSVGLLLVGIVMITLFARHYLLVGLAVMIGVFVFIEASFRGQLTRLVNSLTVGLAVVAALILLYEFFWQVVLVGVLAAGVFIIWQNIRELRR